MLVLSVECWFGQSDQLGPALRGLIVGFLVYGAVVAGFLVYAVLFLNLFGIASLACRCGTCHALNRVRSQSPKQVARASRRNMAQRRGVSS